MHTGPATERDGDWFGAAVNLAARISALAGGGDVVLSDATRDAAGQLQGIAVTERGRHSLRNVREPVLLFDAKPDGQRSHAGRPIDPVCRMAVDTDEAAGSLRHDGIRYYFCSPECAHSFAEHPDRYT
jgi:adenylate cyclase